MHHECLLSARVFDECVSACSVCEGVVDTRLHGVHVHGVHVHGCVNDVYVHVCMCMVCVHGVYVQGCVRECARMCACTYLHVYVHGVHGIMCT